MSTENIECSKGRRNASSARSARDLNCDPAAQLAIQIQRLVSESNFILNTQERSPLFQIAAHLEIPKLTTSSARVPVITDKIFAHVRQEALKSRTDSKTPRLNYL